MWRVVRSGVFIDEAGLFQFWAAIGAPHVPHRAEQQFGAVSPLFVDVEAVGKRFNVVGNLVDDIETGQRVDVDEVCPVDDGIQGGINRIPCNCCGIRGDSDRVIGGIYGPVGICDIAVNIVKSIAEKRGKTVDTNNVMDYRDYKESQYDILAKELRQSLDMDYIYKIMGINALGSNET